MTGTSGLGGEMIGEVVDGDGESDLIGMFGRFRSV